MEITTETTKELRNIEKKLKKNFPNYDIQWNRDNYGDFFVIANMKPFFYYVFEIDFDDMKITMFDDDKSYGSDYFKYISDIYGAIVGLIKPYLTEKKSLKEGQNLEKVGKELCDIFDKYGKDEFFFGLMYLLSDYGRHNEIDEDFTNDILRVLGKSSW